MFCPKCGSPIADGVAFCSNCGNRVTPNQSQPVPAQPQPAPVQPQPVPVQPYPAAAQPQPVPVQPQPAYVQPVYTGWRKWVILAGSICGALAVLVSFIFTFLIGAAAYYPSELGGFIGEVRTEWGIEYFFSGAFEELADTFEAIGNDAPFDMAHILFTIFSSMFGSLIFAGFIIAMIVVFIKSIIRYINHFKGKDTKGISKLTTGAYLFYALGASLIVSMFVSNTSESAFGESVSTGIGYSGATVAGLALGGVFVGLFVASRIAVHGKNLIKLNVLIPGILTVCTCVFAAVVWALAAGPLVGVAEEGASVTYGFLPLIQGLRISSVELENATGAIADVLANKVIVLALSIVSWSLLIVLLCVISKLVTKTVRSLENPADAESGLGLAITQLIFSVIVAIMAIVVLGDDYREVIDAFEGADANLGPVIALLVMSVIVLALTIANKVMLGKYHSAPAPVQPAYVPPQV